MPAVASAIANRSVPVYPAGMDNNYDAVSLFSGGLDSVLAAKVIEAQGLRVRCLHFLSPFFGKPDQLEHFRRVFGVDVETLDVSDEYVAMLAQGPAHGFGRFLNPCIDCKILMLRRARSRMDELGAKCVATGEVIGQRPMSQRRDALNIISRDAGVRDVLIRPLCAKRFDPTQPELTGVVDRERLLNISGRGRKDQLRLAQEFGLTEIPTPAGGCVLAEMESAKRYWPVLKHASPPRAEDFLLANIGRQFWRGDLWLAIGRNQDDNQRLGELARPRDLVFKVQGFPGPICVGRHLGRDWPPEAVRDGAAFCAGFSPKAKRGGGPVPVRVAQGDHTECVTVEPAAASEAAWRESTWDQAREEKTGDAAGRQ